MSVDSDQNDGFTGSLQNEDPIAIRDIARNMQESIELMLILLLVVVLVR